MTTKKRYTEGLLGKKIGMTQYFDEIGNSIPVTVLQVGPCTIVESKTKERNGYSAIKIGFIEKDIKKFNKAEIGNFRKANTTGFSFIKEIRCEAERHNWTEAGTELKVSDIFEKGLFVDVTGTSIGRGFSGVVRRYDVKGQPATRGTHEMRRHIGSIGCCKSPGRVFKNKKMPGQHGNKTRTTLNLKVVDILSDENILLVKGAVPGPKNGLLVVKRSIKKYQKLEACQKPAPSTDDNTTEEKAA